MAANPPTHLGEVNNGGEGLEAQAGAGKLAVRVSLVLGHAYVRTLHALSQGSKVGLESLRLGGCVVILPSYTGHKCSVRHR